MEALNRSEWLLSLEVGDEVALQKNTITAKHKSTERVVVTHVSLMRHKFEVSRKDGTVVTLGLWGSVPWSRSGGVGTTIVPLTEAEDAIHATQLHRKLAEVLVVNGKLRTDIPLPILETFAKELELEDWP